ncbi:thioredoxin family protein [Candidatus Fermentibacteria bacterium]|nr:thioredoxin family protein [Candidatus Fermentibacteria bacterium]
MMIQERDRNALRRLFSEQLVHPVRLTLFTQDQTSQEPPLHTPCPFCTDTVSLVQELAELSDAITVDIRDFLLARDLVQARGVNEIPALLVGGDGDARVRFFGVPAGYEFPSLVEDIVDVSRKTTRLAPRTKERVAKLSTDVHIQVFVTPTCPFCPRAVRLAHGMAMESPRIRADAIEATEFPHLARKYGVMGVPKVVINETTAFEGAIPESAFLLYLLKASDSLTPEEQVKFDALQPSH